MSAFTEVPVYNPYKFSAYNSLAQTLGTAATKITYDSVEFDTSSNFDTTNHRFVAPVAGFYYITAYCSVGSATSLTRAWLDMYKNGSLFREGTIALASSSVSTAIYAHNLFQLAASDYIEIFASSTGHSFASGAGTANCYFTGFLVSIS